MTKLFVAFIGFFHSEWVFELKVPYVELKFEKKSSNFQEFEFVEKLVIKLIENVSKLVEKAKT